jgi:hypothetical protein
MNKYLRRFPGVWAVRNNLRSKFFAFFRHLAAIEDSRQIFSSLLHLNNVMSLPSEMRVIQNNLSPYAELRRENKITLNQKKDNIIFITGRFRSGSTLLWNIFRNIPAITSYYEPFNERRWFDPSARGTRVDSTHIGVSDYWSEYDGLEILGDYYDESWICKQLYMSPLAWNPSMQQYIEIMSEKSKGRPVLQFNQIDLRLPWIRARFPNAKIVHIYRHPRDEWCSTLIDIKKFPKELKIRDFEPLDGFYLLNWGRDLKHYFPFLTLDKNSHPYELFYQIWKLSYGFGCLYSDVSISMEELLKKPESIIKNMLDLLLVNDLDLQKLVSLVKPVPVNKWTHYANHAWFKEIEEKVDKMFDSYCNCYQSEKELNLCTGKNNYPCAR